MGKNYTLFKSNSKINSYIIIMVIIITEKAETSEKEFNQKIKKKN